MELIIEGQTLHVTKEVGKKLIATGVCQRPVEKFIPVLIPKGATVTVTGSDGKPLGEYLAERPMRLLTDKYYQRAKTYPRTLPS